VIIVGPISGHVPIFSGECVSDLYLHSCIGALPLVEGQHQQVEFKYYVWKLDGLMTFHHKLFSWKST
jgi:hypothetical protein